MRFIEITGSDIDLVQESFNDTIRSLPARTADRFDAAVDHGAAAVDAVSTPTMFDPVRVVEVTSPHKVTVAISRKLALLKSDGVVIFHGSTGLSPAVRKTLPDLEQHTFSLPTARESYQWVSRRAEHAGVAIPASVQRDLAEAAPQPIGAHRIHSVIEVMRRAGTLSPTPEQVHAVAGDLSVDTPLWVCADAVMRGDVSHALPAPDVDPIANLSVVATRMIRACVALEQDVPAGDLPKLLGISPAASRMLLKGVRVGPERVLHAYKIVADAEVACRSTADPVLVSSLAADACVRAAELLAERS